MAEKPIPHENDEIRLADFEKKIAVRPIHIEDYDELIAMQRRCFPGMQPWTREQVESQLKMFSDGQLCIEYQGRIVASCTSLVVDFDLHEAWHDWRSIADAGYIRNHTLDGDTMYGIEIMVHPDYRGLRLARRLYAARKELAQRLNLARIIIGGRIPGYAEHADEMTASEYVEEVINRGLYDPVLTTQVANGFVLKELIPNYFPADEASRGYATHLEWTNLRYVRDEKQRWQRVSNTRICTVQYLMRDVENWKEFCRQCEYFLDAAADSKSDFVLFPELFTTQLLSIQERARPSEAVRELAERTSEYLELFTRMAIKYNVNVIGGTQFTHENESLYNVAYLFRRDGTIGMQYKIQVTAEERRWWGVEPGDVVEAFDTDCGKVAILIGYDVQFPELARIAASKGAQILFVPFNTDSREGYLRVRYCAQARAIENDVYVALSGCTGNLPFVHNADVHYAQSGILTPLDYSFARDGVAAECTPNIETLVIHDVDLDLLRRHRKAGTVQPWTDRRLDLYHVGYREGGADQRL
jgi:predicted amidohydrolase/GNAT superfamily N-acetyltransferase